MRRFGWGGTALAAVFAAAGVSLIADCTGNGTASHGSGTSGNNNMSVGLSDNTMTTTPCDSSSDCVWPQTCAYAVSGAGAATCTSAGSAIRTCAIIANPAPTTFCPCNDAGPYIAMSDGVHAPTVATVCDAGGAIPYEAWWTVDAGAYAAPTGKIDGGTHCNTTGDCVWPMVCAFKTYPNESACPDQEAAADAAAYCAAELETASTCQAPALPGPDASTEYCACPYGPYPNGGYLAGSNAAFSPTPAYTCALQTPVPLSLKTWIIGIRKDAGAGGCAPTDG